MHATAEREAMRAARGAEAAMKRALGWAAAVCLAAGLLAGEARAAAPDGHFTQFTHRVLHRATGLSWQRIPAPRPMSQADAAAYCAALRLDGTTGWRLPTLKELATLLDVRAPPTGPAMDTTAFPEADRETYWSSTPYRPAPDRFHWAVQFAANLSPLLPSPSQNLFSVRCVRSP